MSIWEGDYVMSWKSAVKLGAYFGVGFLAVLGVAAAVTYRVVTRTSPTPMIGRRRSEH